jgi:hypothetical protein
MRSITTTTTLLLALLTNAPAVAQRTNVGGHAREDRESKATVPSPMRGKWCAVRDGVTEEAMERLWRCDKSPGPDLILTQNSMENYTVLQVYSARRGKR